MDEEPGGLDAQNLERLFSWTRLLRGAGAATDAKKLILAVLGLLLFHAGRDGIDRLFLPHEPALATAAPPILEPPGPGFPADRASVAADLRSAPWRVTEPARALVAPFLAIFALGSGWRAFLYALLAAAWGAVVWGIFGGAIARIAVVGAARKERIGIGEAVQFARRRWLALVGTPLCPLLGVASFAVLCAVLGLCYRLPVVGPTVGGILAFLPLLAGLVMTIILISTAAGWPLMHATVAAEGEDGFDALSRSFAYVNQRPLVYGGCVAVAWALGALGLIVVDLFARTTVHMAQWALGFGAPGDLLTTFFQGAATSTGVSPTAQAVHTRWLSLVGLVAHGWIYSYFWTAATIIYLILRQNVDGTPWHAIAAPERRPFELEGEPAGEAPGPVDRSRPAGAEPAPTPASPAAEPIASDAQGRA
jgi:hypothetical protein